MDTAHLDAALVHSTLSMADAIAALRNTFLALDRGEIGASHSLGVTVPGGSFHVKACASAGTFVAKVNANFPANPRERGLPTIQGVIAVFDAADGRLLALVDSPSITNLRTAATSALAIDHLAPAQAPTAAVIGCGVQGAANSRALAQVRPGACLLLYDVDGSKANALAAALRDEGVACNVASSLGEALRRSRVVVTCTPSTTPFVGGEDISPGTTIVALGADNERKVEIDPGLLRQARLVTDSTAQCLEIGELKQVPEAASRVAGQIEDLAAGRIRPTRDNEVVVFDSTGLAIEDLALCEALLGKLAQRTSISSTSKTSVALGGITPPAPRAP